MSGGWYSQGFVYVAFDAMFAALFFSFGHHFAAGIFLGMLIGTCAVMLREHFIHDRRK